MLRLRNATPDDCALLAQLHRQNFAIAWSEAEFCSFFDREGIVSLVAEEANASPIGFIFCWAVLDQCELLSLAISESHRKQGIAKALCERALEGAAALGVKTMFLEVAVSNKAAIALYQSIGFTHLHRRKGYYQYRDGSSEDALTMQRVCHER